MNVPIISRLRTGPELIQQSINFAHEKNFLFQADYIYPFGQNGKFEAGVKVTEKTIDNEFALWQEMDGAWIAIPSFSNNLIYTEGIQAAYVMASNKFNKLSVQGGLRAEYTDIKTELTETNEVNPQEYFNLFPSADLSYQLTRDQSLQASYSYRIGRPNFRDLLPFGDFRDTRSLFLGNPNLRPEFTHSIELGYLWEFQAGSILTSVYHRHRENVVQRITEIDENSIARITPINLSTENAYGVELNLNLNPAPWWKLNSSANFFRSMIDGSYKETKLTSDTYTWTAKINSG